jgi:hypothetical protein
MTKTNEAQQEPYCILRVGTGTWTQETYESASRDAGRRTRQLRKLGFTARSSAMGEQITDMGRIKLTMVNIDHTGGKIPPWPAAGTHTGRR